MATRLDKVKVAVLATDGFQQVELTRSVEVLEAAGATVHVVAPKSGGIQGWNQHDKGDRVPVDRELKEARPALSFRPAAPPGARRGRASPA